MMEKDAKINELREKLAIQVEYNDDYRAAIRDLKQELRYREEDLFRAEKTSRYCANAARYYRERLAELDKNIDGRAQLDYYRLRQNYYNCHVALMSANARIKHLTHFDPE